MSIPIPGLAGKNTGGLYLYTVVLYETKFQLRNRTTFFWLRLLLPFFFYAIDGQTVYGVGLFPKKTAQKRRRSSVPKLQQAQSGCL